MSIAGQGDEDEKSKVMVIIDASGQRSGVGVWCMIIWSVCKGIADNFLNGTACGKLVCKVFSGMKGNLRVRA